MILKEKAVSGMKKKLLSIVLAVMMVATCVPAALLATTEQSHAASGNPGLIFAEGKISTDGTTPIKVKGLSVNGNTLTMDGFNYTATVKDPFPHALTLYTDGVCKIVLKGNNVIKVQMGEGAYDTIAGIMASGGITFEGSGTLTIITSGTGAMHCGIMSEEVVTVNSGIIKVTSGKGSAIALPAGGGSAEDIGSAGILSKGGYIQKGGFVAVKADASKPQNAAVLSSSIQISGQKFVYNKSGKYTGKAKLGKFVDSGGTVFYTAKEDGKSFATDVQIGTPPASPKASLKAPTIKAASAGPTSIKVSWKKVKGAKGYQVYRATSKSGKYKKVKTTSKTSYTNSKLKKNKKYYYKVRAYKKSGSKTVYSKFSKTKYAVAKMKAPAFKLKLKGRHAVTVKWKGVAGADKYRLYRANSKNGKYVLYRDTIKKSYTNTGLKHKHTYYYKMRAYKVVKGKKVFGSFSAVQKIKTK